MVAQSTPKLLMSVLLYMAARRQGLSCVLLSAHIIYIFIFQGRSQWAYHALLDCGFIIKPDLAIT